MRSNVGRQVRDKTSELRRAVRPARGRRKDDGQPDDSYGATVAKEHGEEGYHGPAPSGACPAGYVVSFVGLQAWWGQHGRFGDLSVPNLSVLVRRQRRPAASRIPAEAL